MFNAIVVALVMLAGEPLPSDTTFAVPREGRLEVGSPAGNVRVQTWDRAELRVRSASAARGGVTVRRQGSVIYIESSGRNQRGGDLEITVPAAYSVSIQGLAVDADIRGVTGGVSFSGTHGSLRVRGSAGGVRAEGVSGDIDLNDVRGAVHAKATNGDVRIAGVQGDVFAETINGEIVLNGITAASVDASSVNGEIRFAGHIAGNGRYRFSTHNGDIVITAPERTSATFHMSTYHGRITAAFPIQVQPGSAGSRTTFALGGGSARVEVETFNGNLRLVRP